jgi:hypothetical protein
MMSGMIRVTVLPNFNAIIWRMGSVEYKSKCAERATDDIDAMMADAWESLNMDDTPVLEVDSRLL